MNKGTGEALFADKQPKDRIQYETQLMGTRVLVQAINIDAQYCCISVECPLLNIHRENVPKQPIIDELEKVLSFLKSDGGNL